jgi:phospholipid/cholesterol/gamma-HCH transport system substrate-binding protein
MAKKVVNHIKLGIFVSAGLFFLILLLYMIGKNQNLFGATFALKARFDDVHGLVPGNSVRFSGISAGTVKAISVLDDGTIEVTMLIKTKMKKYIHKNAQANVGTDGLMGNKLINIIHAKPAAPIVDEGDVLVNGKSVDTEAMLSILDQTNQDVAIIASGLKATVQRINSSAAFWEILNDKSLPYNLRSSLNNARTATDGAKNLVDKLQLLVADVKSGKGSLGILLRDSSFSQKLEEAVEKIKNIGIQADTLSGHINELVVSIDKDVNSGKGTANALLKDEGLVLKMNSSLNNIEKGTESFNQLMEALKKSFLFKGYFKKLERQKNVQLPSTSYKSD